MQRSRFVRSVLVSCCLRQNNQCTAERQGGRSHAPALLHLLEHQIEGRVVHLLNGIAGAGVAEPDKEEAEMRLET